MHIKVNFDMTAINNIVKAGSIFILLIFAVTICVAQVKVTGHVFAEIVETVSASSNTNDYFLIEQNNIGDELNLGEISLYGKSNSVVSVLVTTNGMTGSDGENTGFEVIPCLECSGSNQDNYGNQTYKLQAFSSSELNSNSSKSYSAKYEVVFAHN